MTFLVVLVLATGFAGFAIERVIVARDRARNRVPVRAERPTQPAGREPVREPVRVARPMRAPAARPPVRRPAAPYFGQPPGRTVPLPDNSYRRWRPQGGVPR